MNGTAPTNCVWERAGKTPLHGEVSDANDASKKRIQVREHAVGTALRTMKPYLLTAQLAAKSRGETILTGGSTLRVQFVDQADDRIGHSCDHECMREQWPCWRSGSAIPPPRLPRLCVA